MTLGSAPAPHQQSDWNKGEQLALSVVIPAYNEAGQIVETLRETYRELCLLEMSFEILVVDDGSIDGTYEEAQRYAQQLSRGNAHAIRVLRYEENGGKGRAVAYGVRHSSGAWVAFLDADLDLHPRLLGRLIDLQAQTAADIVIGSKRHPASVIDYPLMRRIYSSGYYLLCRLLFGLPVHDTQTGIKLLPGEFCRQIFPALHVQRFAFDLELLVRAHQSGLVIVEAPIEMTFRRRFGRIGLRDIAGITRDTFSLWWRLQRPSRQQR